MMTSSVARSLTCLLVSSMAASLQGAHPIRLLMPALWPEAHLAEMVLRDKNEKVKPAVCSPFPTFGENIATAAAVVPKIILGVLVYTYLVDIPAAATFQMDWMLRIILRDLVLLMVIAGGWDWLLYFSPLKNKMHKYKYNPEYPPLRQFKHDIFWSISATISSSLIEIYITHLWAAGKVPIYLNFWAYPAWSLIWLFGMPWWRIVHFHLIHRMMHPWRTKNFPDVGQFLYKYVHSLHHQSPNPTSFSGVSMHPVESTLYFSAALVPSFFLCHPLHFLVTKFDLAIAAQIGHDGFGAPATGSHYHYIHHAKFDCNYGDKLVPLDWVFGTYSDGTRKKAK